MPVSAQGHEQPMQSRAEVAASPQLADLARESRGGQFEPRAAVRLRCQRHRDGDRPPGKLVPGAASLQQFAWKPCSCAAVMHAIYSPFRGKRWSNRPPFFGVV
jgi:hypothetical protein